MGEESPINSLGLVEITSPEKALKHAYALEETASPLNTGTKFPCISGRSKLLSP